MSPTYKNRSVAIKYNDEDGFYTITLFDSNIHYTVPPIKRTTNNYHEIGIIVSNWIVNGY
jgi:hypothetical protein